MGKPFINPTYTCADSFFIALPLLLISISILVVGQHLHLRHLCKLSFHPDHLFPVTCRAKCQILHYMRQTKPLHFQSTQDLAGDLTMLHLSNLLEVTIFLPNRRLTSAQLIQMASQTPTLSLDWATLRLKTGKTTSPSS